MTTNLDAIRARWAPVAPSDGTLADDLRRSMESVTRTMNYHHAPEDVATLLAEVKRLRREQAGASGHSVGRERGEGA